MDILFGVIIVVLVIANVVLLVAMMRNQKGVRANGEQQAEQRMMQQDIRELKRALTGVKTRGIWGEWQLGSILSELLTKEQYEQECMVIPGSANRVEYAVKLPGRFEQAVYLPIDSKFPMDAFLQLEEARAGGNREVA